MKKIIAILVLIIGVVGVSGCFKRDDYEDVTIYTTTYPVEYITKELYGENAEILSIYPSGANYYEYSLSEKQIKEYSKAAIFIYNGLSDEKEIARNFINENHNMKIIDVAYGLSTSYGIEELWLSPNNLLMLASTVKNNLQELIENKYMNEEIDENFAVLEENLSILDAELRSTANAAISTNTETLIIATDSFAFLNDYGFKTISISNENTIDETLKNNFKNEKYKYILIAKDQEISESIQNLVDNYSAKLVYVDTMLILDDKQKTDGTTYMTIMKNFLENIKNIVLTDE